ncbi:MAG: putative glycoside hydrolase [Thermomicrobiales bacterium]
MQSRQPTVRFGRTAARPASGSFFGARQTIPAREGRQWNRLTWPVSISLFAIPVALALATLMLPRFAAAPDVMVRVTDRYTGNPIPGAEIVLADDVRAAGDDGSVVVETPQQTTALTIQSPGYEAVTTTLTRDGPSEWQVALRPTVLRGTVTDAENSAGIEGASIALVAPDGTEQVTTTDREGRYAFDAVPDGAVVRFSSADYGVAEETVGQRTEIDLAVQASFVAGQVTDATGAPIAGARVAAANGSAESLTAADGTFRLTGGTDITEVAVSAPGFAGQILPVDDSRQVSAALDVESIKAVYANLGVLSEPERWNRLIEIADTTEINAIVIDVKQDTIYYDTQVPFFREIDGMVTPIFDAQELLAELDEHGIYSIARMVVFKDPVVAEGRPDLAVRDEVTGDLWRDMNGAPWVNAFHQELWTANADLGAELAQLGFDEVQYDYIRFPSDGDLRTADFGHDYSEASRREAITGAVAIGGERIRAAGAQFAVDLFPIIALMGDDQGIGQTLQDLTPLADYVCLMIYPSHYITGNIPVDGHPNDFPAETVTYTLERSQEIVPGTMAKMRPWLQDFTYPLEGYSVYGPAEVRAQIDAAEGMGVSGWLLWNAAGEFEAEALAPE